MKTKTNPKKKPLTFGDFVAAGYRVWGERKAPGIIHLAVLLDMIEFRGQKIRMFR